MAQNMVNVNYVVKELNWGIMEEVNIVMYVLGKLI